MVRLVVEKVLQPEKLKNICGYNIKSRLMDKFGVRMFILESLSSFNYLHLKSLNLVQLRKVYNHKFINLIKNK